MLPYSLKCMRNKIYVYVFAIQSMLCTDYELFDMFYNEIQFFGCISSCFICLRVHNLDTDSLQFQLMSNCIFHCFYFICLVHCHDRDRSMVIEYDGIC